jgi:hypothetical protein
VWTLNVDDAFERAYRRASTAGGPELESVSWDDPFSEGSSLQVVHLHGHVLGGHARRLVFSFGEYQSAAAENAVWAQAFSNLVAEEPFVVIGARILDDPDIENALLNQTVRTAAPTFIVDPYISEGNSWELQQQGYIVVPLSGEEFLDSFLELAGIKETDLSRMLEAPENRLPQLVELRTNHVPSGERSHDYLAGDVPIWRDAVDDRIARAAWTQGISRRFEAWRSEPSMPSEAYIVYGDRFTGVSSGLWYLYRQFCGKEVRVFSFDGSSRFDPDSVVDLAGGGRTIVIGIESGADFADDVDRLLTILSTKPDCRVFILLAETPRRALRLESRLRGPYLRNVVRVPSQMKHQDAAAVVDLLKAAGRMGRLELVSYSEQVAHFVGRDIFSAMLDVEYAAGFRRRITTELDNVPLAALDLLLLLGLASAGHRDVTLAEAAVATGTSTGGLRSLLQSSDALPALVSISGELVAARQRDRIVSELTTSLGSDECLKRLAAQVRRLVPLANRRSLAQRNRPALLVSHLLSADSLSTTFPDQDIDAVVYEQFGGTLGSWNGRYWEQRAIYAKKKYNWGVAESYAARAVSLYDGAFARTTYGTILINRAEVLADWRDSKWVEYYRRGTAEINRALSTGSETRVAAFAYLTATLDLAGKLRVWAEAAEGGDTPVEGTVEVRTDWVGAYTQLRKSLTNEEHLASIERAEALSARWERLAA